MGRNETVYKNTDGRFVPCIASRPCQVQPEVCHIAARTQVGVEFIRFLFGDSIFSCVNEFIHIVVDFSLIWCKPVRR